MEKTYLTCKKEGLHEGECLNLLCLEKDCKFDLICAICHEEFHKDHKTSSIKKLRNQFKSRMQSKKENDFLSILERKRTSILNSIDLYIEKLLDEFKNYKESINDIFDEIKKIDDNFDYDITEIDEKFEILLGNKTFDDDCEINKALEILYPIFFEKEKSNIIQREDYLNEILNFQSKNIKKVQNSLETTFHEIFNKSQRNLIINPEINQIMSLNNYSFYNSNFHKDFCHQSFHIRSGGKKIIYNKGEYNFFRKIIALGEKALPMHKKSIFGFKIFEESYVSLGVALIGIAKNNEFTANTFDINNGLYMSDGRKTYSNHDSSINNKLVNLGVNFNHDERIYVCVNPFANKITFSNIEGKKFSIDFKLNKCEFLHPGLIIEGNDKIGKIEILNEFELREESIINLFK